MRYPVRYGNYRKFSTNILTDQPGMVAELFSKDLKSEYVKYLMKGIKLGAPKIQIGMDGEDFILDRFTVRSTRIGHRIPRFLKNHLLRHASKLQQLRSKAR